jgi:putative ABC transport system permease protein
VSPVSRTWADALLLSLRFLGRDWRSGELRLLVLSVVVAVTAMTSVGFFADRLKSGLERDAAQLLGADLVISGDAELPPELRGSATQRGLTSTETVTFPSMVIASSAARLASIKAVGAGYPLRGALRIAPAMNAPDAVASGRPGPGEVWVDGELLAQLGVPVGTSVRLGDSSVTITRVITLEPDRGLSFVNIAPRLLMRLEDLPPTHLIQLGSRENYHLMVAGALPAIDAFSQWVKPQLGRGQRLESIDSARPEVRAALTRAEQFLSLVSLLTALLAAVAVAMAARRFAERHLDGCAVMRCLGATQSDLLRLYLIEFVVIGAAGAAIGTLVGLGAHLVFVELLGSLIETRLPAPHVTPALQGLLVGFVLLVGFALPPIVRLRQVPALRVLRRETRAPSVSSATGYAIGALLFLGLLLWTAQSPRVGLITAGGFAGALVVFAGTAFGTLRLVARARHAIGLNATLRFALASMRRRSIETVAQTVALSLGLMALLLLTVTRTDLIDAWRRSVPADAPNRFAINIQPDERAGFAQQLRTHGVAGFDLAPMVRGRLIAINGQPIDLKQYPDERAKRLVDREFNLSYGDTLPEHNEVASGAWFKPDAGDELSIEQGVAKDLGIKLGDTLRFKVADQEIEARATSLRKLDWDSMHVNFFVIFPRRALEPMPQTWISAFHLSNQQSAVANDLAHAYPNISIIDVGAVLSQVQGILDQVIAAVQFLFVFTLIAGVLVLYGALISSRDERTREAALMRALGASRAQLARSQSAEFALLGALAGVLAAAGSVAIGYLLAREVFEFAYHFSVLPWICGMVGGVAITLVGGWLGLRPVLAQPPLMTLRDA